MADVTKVEQQRQLDENELEQVYGGVQSAVVPGDTKNGGYLDD